MPRLAGLGAAVARRFFAGHVRYAEGPLQPSDAILVISGTSAEGPFEAWGLYRDGYPLIVLTREAPDMGGVLA
jgi:hypothetical protein